MQALLLVSGFLHHMLFPLPQSPAPSSQQLVSVLKPLEIVICALRSSPARRSSVHDQLYVGQKGGLTGDSSTLFEFALQCLSGPFSAPETLTGEQQILHSLEPTGDQHQLGDSNFSLYTTTAAPIPHGLTAQALLQLSAMPCNPVWLSAFMLAAATIAVQTLDPPMLSRLLATASNVVKRVLIHNCMHKRTQILGAHRKSCPTSSRDLAEASPASDAGCDKKLAACAEVDLGSRSQRPSSTGFPLLDSQPASLQQHKSDTGGEPQVCADALLNAAKVSCMRAQTAVQHSAAFAVLHRISGDLAVAFKQQCETCCPAIACQRLLHACPASHAASSQSTATVQVLSCSNDGNIGCEQGACSSRVLLAGRCPIRHPSGSPRGQEVQGSMMVFHKGQVADWSLTATANAAEAWRVLDGGAGCELGFSVKLVSHSACSRDIRALVVIIPDYESAPAKKAASSSHSTEEESEPSRLRGSGSEGQRSKHRHVFGQPAASTTGASVYQDASGTTHTCKEPSSIHQCIAQVLDSLKTLTLERDSKGSILNNETLLRSLSEIRARVKAPVAGQLFRHNFTDVGEAACCESFVFCDVSASSEWHTAHGLSSRQSWNWWVGKVVNVFCVVDQA